jgi:alkanesulfonate monooxygenase
MPVEFIGMVSNRPQSELTGGESGVDGPLGRVDGPPLDVEHLTRFIRVHEEGEFDRILIGYFAGAPDGWAISSYAASITDRLGFLMAHRPGFVAPTVAARKAATLDVLSGGRFAMHIITGGSDIDQQRDGDYLDKVERYARTSEFLDIARQDWVSDHPFDYEGRFYRVSQAFSAIKSLQQPHIPVYFGGSSNEALDVAAKHADVWATWGEPLAEVKAQIADLHSRARPFGRKPGVSVSFRPILGATEEKAWERAHQILERIKIVRGDAPPPAPANAGSQRLLDAAKGGHVRDERLYTAIAEVTGARGNSTALVGTPDQVAETLLQYNEAGCTTLLIRGYNPVEDAIDYGRDLLPIVRDEVRLRDLRALNEAARAQQEVAERAAAQSSEGGSSSGGSSNGTGSSEGAAVPAESVAVR